MVKINPKEVLEQIVERVVGGIQGYAQQPSRLAFDFANYFIGYRFLNHPSDTKVSRQSAWSAAITSIEIMFSLLEPGKIPYIVAVGEAVRPLGMAVFKGHDYVTDRICHGIKKVLSRYKRSGEQK